MGDARNCRKCGKLFNYIGGMPICQSCRVEEEDEFKRIKDYLYEFPGASLNQIATELDVSIKKLKMYLREGRLEIVGSDDGNVILECEMCGKSIKTGHYCAECSVDATRNLKSVATKMKEKIDTDTSKSTGMRYLYKEDKK